MKKILVLTLTGLLAFGGSGMAVALAATSPENSPAVQAELTAETQNNLYLAPGTYILNGETVENTIPSGADKLSEEECEAIYSTNVYLCTLSVGETLPVPESVRVDKEGEPYIFNGWWTIVDANVTYFETVPELSETTFLYADWRADLSMRKEPIEVDSSTVVQANQYMEIYREATGETEIVNLGVSGTDASTADKFGYSAPVQFYNGYFELNPGDYITVYAKGLGGSEEIQVAPLVTNGTRTITLEFSSTENNDTRNYLSVSGSKLDYIASTSRHFRIYIKFYDDGETMTVYMQPKD